MDYVTRQFINLTKKFRKELRNYVSNLNSALHKQTEAICESHQVSNDKQGPSPEVTILNNLPSSIEIHQNEKDAKDERNYKRFMFLVTTMTLGALVVYADLVYLQYLQMVAATVATHKAADAADSAAHTAQSALQASQEQFRNEQRPYIWLAAGTATKTQLVSDSSLPMLQQQGLNLLVNIQASNGGHSPAVEIRVTKTIIWEC